MGVKFSNNAKTTLSASVSTSATSVSVASSSGFPSLSGGDYFYATMVQQSDDTALEIVKVTAVSGTTWTVSRAQDNTSATAFASGDKIELRASAGVFIDLFAEKAPIADPTFTGNLTIGSAQISETELEILDGATVTTDELNKLDGTTATATSLTYGKDLYDTGVTAAEFDYLDGVTSNIQTQISTKLTTPSGFARGSVIIGDSSGNPANLSAGANGYVLKSDGTDVTWAEDEKTTTTNFVKNAFTGDNTTTAFTLSQSPNSEDNLIVFIEGVFQNQGDYALSGTTLTFDEAPATGRKIVAYHVKAAVSGANLNHDQFTASGSAAFTLSITPINENNTQVFIDGVYQQKTDYSVSGTTLTFDTAPASGAIVEVMTFTQTEINVPTTGSVVTASIVNDVNLNGNPTTTTQSAGNNTTRIATTAFVETAVSNLIDSAPGTMNTLNEIAAALGDDPSFTTTVNNAIATKLPLSGGTMTGNIAHASDFTIDAGGDIILDADGADIKFADAGTTVLEIKHESSSIDFLLNTTNDDFKFKGSDDGSTITALTLDMSEAGKATFNAGADLNNTLKITRTGTDDAGIILATANANRYIASDENGVVSIGTGTTLTGGTQYLTIDSGKVAIGSPTANKLFNLADPAEGGEALKLHFEAVSSADKWAIYTYDRTNGHVADMSFGANYLYLKSGGNIGIGTTAPATQLQLLNAGESMIRMGYSTTQYAQIGRNSDGTYEFSCYENGGVLKFGTTTSNSATTERMRIDSSGRLLHQTTGATTYPTNTVYAMHGVGGDVTLKLGGYGGSHTMMQFLMSGNNVKGSIVSSQTATTYNTTSDSRLKDVTGEARGLEVINALNPVSYNWKEDGQADEGLIAQEVMEIVPNAVCGSEEDFYQMDYSKLVTPLIKAIQEQQEQIEQLKTEIQTLKG